MKLIIDGKPAVKGQEVTTSRGEKFILLGWAEPAHAGSTGRVYVETGNETTREFYPSVIGGKFVSDEQGC